MVTTFITRAIRWLRWRVRELKHRLFFNRSIVYRLEAASPEPRAVPGLQCMRIRRDVDLGDDLRTELVARFGESAVSGDVAELAQNAEYWVARVQGAIVATLMSRRGRHFHRWFVALETDDIVIFRSRTHEDHRGRGIAPAFYRAVLSEAIEAGEHGYVDCRVHNAPSIRSIEKAGFSRIAKMKPLSRDDAIA